MSPDPIPDGGEDDACQPDHRTGYPDGDLMWISPPMHVGYFDDELGVWVETVGHLAMLDQDDDVPFAMRDEE